MAERNWTEGQRNCIDARGGTVLVSAAAGSGKTAVLVQRVINRITDPVAPTDLDRLLIVTFTHAAAAEMKQRLSAVLAEKLAEDPRNAHLRRQQRLLTNANISTVHAFCGKLLKEYYYLLDISPQYKLVDTPTEKLLKADAIAEMLEVKYAEKDPTFIHLANAIGSSKKDDDLVKTIQQIYEFIQSYPFPEEWLHARESSYDDTVPFAETIFGKTLLQGIRDRIAYAMQEYETALDLINGVSPLEQTYGVILSKEHAQLSTMMAKLQNADWDTAVAAVADVDFQRMNGPKKFPDEDLKKRVKALRDNAKELVQKAQEIMIMGEADARNDLKYHTTFVQTLFALVREFEQRYTEKKAERRLLDFSDLEHMALKLLITLDDNGEMCQTPLAKEIAERFDEILVDEYQDTNAAQDALFRAVSKDEQNLFMVGDVKQSVYGFRKAMPELFLGRRNRYTPYDGTQYPAAITLGHNFRSRKEVTGIVNFLFKQWMSVDLCGMDYDQNEELVARAKYISMPDRDTELLIVNAAEEDDDTAEAQVIANRIHELHGHFLVEEDAALRPMTYRDVVILLRSTKGHAQTYVDVLRKNGIPAYTDEAVGFFESTEVARTMSLLRIIDNPAQDVPLVSVMLSPLFGFSPDDLAAIRTVDRKCPLFVALKKAIRHSQLDENLRERLAHFLKQIERFRSEAGSLPADRLIRLIYEETQYPAVVRAGVHGASKAANLQLLYRYAKQFEQNGFRGLSAFIRFCDRLEQQDLDMEAATGNDQEDAVHVMTIHHSKGLEFPVVFVARLGAKFNTESEKNELLLHNHMGLGMQRRDPQTVRRYKTLPHLCVKQAIRQSDRAEEARVLYVAFTRAKEKLIMVLSSEKAEEELAAARYVAGKSDKIPAFYLQNASTFGQWIFAAVARHPDVTTDGLPCNEPLTVRILQPTTADEDAEPTDAYRLPGADTALVDKMRAHMTFRYPFEASCRIPTKITASHLPGEPIFIGKTACKPPAFAQQNQLTPAERGTAMHTFMQFADLAAAETDFAGEIKRQIDAGHLTEDQAKVVDEKKVRTFLSSNLYRRMKAADQMLREWRFSMAAPAADLLPQAAGIHDTVTVQGMIDCAFIEGDHVVLMDYKTDRVKSGDELIDRYQNQLLIYAKALEHVLHLPVKEAYLYSFALAKAVNVPLA